MRVCYAWQNKVGLLRRLASITISRNYIKVIVPHLIKVITVTALIAFAELKIVQMGYTTYTEYQ